MQETLVFQRCAPFIPHPHRLESPRITQNSKGEKEADARLRASSAASCGAPPSIYLLVSQEPVGRRPWKGAQVSQQPLSPQIELDDLHQSQSQAEHQSQVQRPRPAIFQPRGLHHSALATARGWVGGRCGGGKPGSFLQLGAGSPSPLPSESSV